MQKSSGHAIVCDLGTGCREFCLSCMLVCHFTLVTIKTNKQCEGKFKDRPSSIVVQQNWLPSVKPGWEENHLESQQQASRLLR